MGLKGENNQVSFTKKLIHYFVLLFFAKIGKQTSTVGLDKWPSFGQKTVFVAKQLQNKFQSPCVGFEHV